jgi:hypothetical protein
MVVSVAVTVGIGGIGFGSLEVGDLGFISEGVCDDLEIQY